ncbi:hypothetical protein M6G65_31860 [Methylobacterium tardum]|uniref:hypothetical protein n=1 Tax=Methylobacterium tardum TaxID=374432 RepID=UPI0020201708|nr:hypothetical protein [Methylobacterium tardum]URD36848.1 hypothetical protein M6G65_31860 [Methylobacterium tardum]
MSATAPRDAGDGVWLAEGSWLTKKTYDRPAALGWLAWSYAPGRPGEVEVLVRGATAAAAVDRFWQAYDAARGTFAGRRVTPADRELAWEPPTVEFADIEGEDLDALADLCAGL